MATNKKSRKKSFTKRAKSASDKPKTPDDKIVEEARKGLKACIDDDADERVKMMDDLRFCTLDQWPEDIRRERENDVENGPRPCLTIDKINQYIVQVVNDMRQGKPGINVRPQDDESDIETAKVLKGLVRNIEDQSNADIAYATAGESAAKIGVGYFRITTEYVSDDSFDQEIFIRPIPNTFSVYMSRHTMPDGSDADRAYIVESMSLEKFKADYPKAKWKTGDFEGLGDAYSYWRNEESVTVIEEYCFETSVETLLFLADGSTISQADYDAWPKEAGVKPSVQDQRSTTKRQLKWRKMTGIEPLDQRDLPGKWIPIVEVIGRESNIEGKRVLWGLVRPAKDSLRMYNYWASTLTEKFALSPKTPFIGAVGQFASANERWKKANRVNYSFLEYDNVDHASGNPLPAPVRQGPMPMEAAYFHQMQTIEHDVQTSLGMFKAATGESESQQSGRAILALQKESDTGTYHFGANQGISIRHAGRIIVGWIPHYYDAKRIVRILGEDGEVQSVQLDPEQDVSHRQIQTQDGIKSIYNPGVGKYDVSITVGPGYNTQRMEAAAMFVELSKGAADPASAAVLRYLTVKNSDSAGAEEAAKMLKALLPPQAIQAVASGDQQAIPPQAIQHIAQLTQAAQAMHQQLQKLGQENMQLKAGAQVSAMKIRADQEAAQADYALQKQKQESEAKLAWDKANAEIKLKTAVAEAELQLEKLKLGVNADGAIDTAIAKVANLALIHQTKVQAIFDKEAAARDAAAQAEGQAADQASAQNSTAQVNELQRQFSETIQQIVGALTAKKKISLIHDGTGNPTGAEVSMQQ